MHSMRQRIMISESARRRREGRLSIMSINTMIGFNKTPTSVRAYTCQWPVGDPLEPGFRYCGLDVSPGKPYCFHHCETSRLVKRMDGDKNGDES